MPRPKSSADEEAFALHSRLAKVYYDAHKQQLARTVGAADEVVPEGVQASIDSDTATEYTPVETDFGGLLFVVVNTKITEPTTGTQYTFRALGGGLAAGASVSWGAAWLNDPLDEIDGWEFRLAVPRSSSNAPWRRRRVASATRLRSFAGRRQ